MEIALYIYYPRSSYVYDVDGTGSDGLDDTKVYAKVSSVPIPGAIWLFGSGLIGIVGIRRKLKN